MSTLSDAALDHLRALDESPLPSTDRYEVLGPLGQGGMGIVYRVRDRELGREVALKVVSEASMDDAAAQRLLREARALARLEHPGIVPVHDVGQLRDGRLYYVMKLVEGHRLDERLSSGMGLGDALRAFVRICDAVAFAHAHGVIHRDLKPQNVMLGPFGDVLVLDWGVAKLRGMAEGPWEGQLQPQHQHQHPVQPPATRPSNQQPGSSTATRSGLVLGTPGYMAPEQAAGDGAHVDERSDVFSLGVLLRDILASQRDEGAPAPLRSIVQRATAHDPDARYASAADLAFDVSAWLDGQPVRAHRETLAERLGRLARRHRTALALIAVYLLVRMLMLLVTRGRSG